MVPSVEVTECAAGRLKMIITVSNRYYYLTTSRPPKSQNNVIVIRVTNNLTRLTIQHRW